MKDVQDSAWSTVARPTASRKQRALAQAVMTALALQGLVWAQAEELVGKRHPLDGKAELAVGSEVEELIAGNVFDWTSPLLVDKDDNVHVRTSSQVLRIAPDGTVSVAFDGSGLFLDPWQLPTLRAPVALDDFGNLYVRRPGRLFKVDPFGHVTLVSDDPLLDSLLLTGGLVVDGSGVAYRPGLSPNVVPIDTNDVELLRIAMNGDVSVDVILNSVPFCGLPEGVELVPDDPGRVIVWGVVGAPFIFCYEPSYLLEVAPDGSTVELIGPGGDGQGNGLERVRGVAFDDAGCLYVGDGGGEGDAWDVFKVAPDGTVAQLIDPALLGGPVVDIDVSPTSGNVLVLCVAAPGRLLEITAGGEVVRALDVPVQPHAIAADSTGNAYVLGSASLLRVTPGSLVSEVLSRDLAGMEARLDEPRGLAIGPSGEIVIADDGYRWYSRWSPSGGGPEMIADGDHPIDVAIDSAGTSYLVDFTDATVQRVEPDGVVTVILGPAGDGVHSLDQPWAIAVDDAGNTYVPDSDLASDVFRVSASGEITTIVDASGDGVNALAFPRCVAVDHAGNVYVGGSVSDNVFRVTPEGSISQVLDRSGDGDAEIDYIRGICVDHAGNVYVAGYWSNNVFRVSPSGVVTEIIDQTGDGTHELLGPIALAATPWGSVVVAGYDSDNAFEVAADGTVMEIIASDALGPDSLLAPSDVAVGADGAIYLSGEGSRNVLRIPAPVCAPLPDASFRNAGTNPPSYTVTPASVGGTLHMTVNLATTRHSQALVLGFDSPFELPLAGGQTLLCLDLLGSGGELINTGFHPGPLAEIDLAVPNEPALAGFHVSTQALHAFGVVPFALSNAQDVVIGGCP